MTPIENLCAAIELALDDCAVSEVLSIVTGAFVGLTVKVVREAGHDTTKPIMIDCGAGRDITIHPPKPVTLQNK